MRKNFVVLFWKNIKIGKQKIISQSPETINVINVTRREAYPFFLVLLDWAA